MLERRQAIGEVLGAPGGGVAGDVRRDGLTESLAAGSTAAIKRLRDASRLVKTDLDEDTAAALERLSGADINEIPTSELDELQRALNAWMSQTIDSKPLKDDSRVKANLLPQLRRLSVELREVMIDRNVEARQTRNKAIAAGSRSLSEALATDAEATSAGEFRAALDGCRAQMEATPRDGKELKRQLTAIQQKGTAWLESNGSHAQASAVRDLIAKATEELAEIAEVEAAVAKLQARDAGWDPSGEGVLCEAAGLRIESGGHDAQNAVGKAGTAESQAVMLDSLIETEAMRSTVFAELIKDLANRDNADPMLIRLGDNAAGFVDSAGTMGVDMNDMASLPRDPVTVDGPGDAQLKGGVTQGEILMHVLEERMLMAKFSGAYQPAHEACLSADSFQNRYRRELGVPADSLVFDCHGHHGCCEEGHNHPAESAEPHRQKMDFLAYDSQGVVMTVANLSGNKASAPNEDYDVPPVEQTTYEHADLDASLDRMLADGWSRICDDLERKIVHNQLDEGELINWGADPAKIMLQSYMARRYPAAELPDQQRAIERAAAAEVERIKRKLAAQREEQQRALAEKTEKAAAHLNAVPEADDAGSRVLQALRGRRQCEGLNDGKGTDTHQNCAMTTMGAICGKTSGKAVEDFLVPAIKAQLERGVKIVDMSERMPLADAYGRKKTPEKEAFDAKLLEGTPFASGEGGEAEKAAKKLAAHFKSRNQKEDLFWLAKDIRRLGLSAGKAAAMKSDNPDAVGDAQLEGIRGLLAQEAERRNGANDGRGVGGVKFQVVQDGVADVPEKGGKMYPIEELFGRMKKFPNGTQFQVFLRGPTMPGHWVYGEMYNKKLVIEDYQKATAARGGGGEAPTAFLADESAPHNPITDEPDVFEKGMYIAMCPDDHEADVWNGNPSWPAKVA